MMTAKHVDTHIDPNANLLSNQGKPLSNPKTYKRLVAKVLCLTILPNTSISMVNQFLNPTSQRHWDIIIS